MTVSLIPIKCDRASNLRLCEKVWRGSETAAAGGAAQTPKAHMNMLQLMRAFPFPHANVLFDAHAKDPVGPEKKQSSRHATWRGDERHLISAYVAEAGEDLHCLQTRSDEVARHLLAEASRCASVKLSEIEARFRYLRTLHGDSSRNV
jgi:hypothetical protein